MRMALSRSPKAYYAELEARRFSLSELHEFLSVWFPRTAAFAVMRGGSLSAVVPQDKAMDCVGQFFVKLSLDDKARWDAYFTGRTWWAKDMPKQLKDLMTKHNTGVTHYAFKNASRAGTLTVTSPAWFLNALYQDACLTAADTRHAFIWTNFKDN
jgi:hypothetical protein